MSARTIRLSCLSLCLTLTLLLAACSGSAAGETPPPEQEDAPAGQDAQTGGESAQTPEPEPEDPGGPMKEGYRYRDFTATLANGESFTLSDHEGKVILLNFWATWCGPCVGEMPAFPRLVETFGEDLALVAVNCGEDEATVDAFLEENGYEFTVVMDPDYAVSDLYPSDGIPYTLIISPDGTVVSITVGAAGADAMYDMYAGYISELLA